jgi:hypothetical protein
VHTTTVALCRILWTVVALLATPAIHAQEAGRSDFQSVEHFERFERFEQEVRPVLVAHCYGCHSQQVEKPKGDFRIDQLPPQFSNDAVRDRWLAIRELVVKGEMPPKTKPRLTPAERATLIEWISRSFPETDETRATRHSLRRLSRVEYENTIRDLLSIEIELKDNLPQDTSADGFDNNAGALHVSSFLMETYLEAADKALALAIANRPKPPSNLKRYYFQDERHVKSTTEHVFRTVSDALVMFSSSPWQSITLSQFYPPERGRYRFRLSAYGFQGAGSPVTFRVDAGPMLMGTKNHLVDYFHAAPDEPSVIEFTEHQEARSTIRILPYGLASAQAVHQVGADQYQGPGLAVQWIDVEGPINDLWPPPSHRQIFGDLPQAPVPVDEQRDRLEVTSSDAAADGRRILHGFAERAFRRNVTDSDVAPFLAILQSQLDDDHSFEQAIRVALKAMLVSPEFLFRREGLRSGGDFGLASRLSYFLWSTMPDDALRSLAAQNKLHDPGVLRSQVERMLASPKAAALTENFLGQWLNLRDIDFTEPDRRLYPEFDDMLKAAMVQETQSFFDELLKCDLSITNFVASDFSMLNERLARHYGIPGVDGNAFRRVALPGESHRGGVMTMASVLKVTANGTTTSPVVRGAWVLDRIVGTPPKPPPAGVPAIEPDIRGATTIRQQLAQHRQIESCAACHAQIDPPGFALESFDVIGGWRDYYRTVQRGKSVTVDGRNMPYLRGPDVDPTDVLPDGRRFQDIDEFKKLLLEDKDQLARSLARKLLTYATGRAPDASDESEVDAIVGSIRERDYGLRSLVHAIVQSKLFQDM